MKYVRQILFLFLSFFISNNILVAAMNIISADNPNIQYYGRWDFTNPKAPAHSWGGVYIYAEFEGTSIGMITNDNDAYYNIFIDDSLSLVFHGTLDSIASYTLVSGLKDGKHKILITKRYETTWAKYSFNGFILDDGKNLLPPPPKPERKIEFVGDSYTSAEGNEWSEARKVPDNSYSNMYKSFGSNIARHYNAQYHLTSRSGIGLVVDWQGNYENNMPDFFDRTLFSSSEPKWDFSKWIPDLVVICLGLNDYNGWGGYTGTVDSSNTILFKKKYHEFISTIVKVYPNAKILLVAANDLEWIKQQASNVATEENVKGNANVYYTYFPFYEGFYVNDGHPNAEADRMIAEKLIETIDKINVWD